MPPDKKLALRPMLAEARSPQAARACSAAGRDRCISMRYSRSSRASLPAFPLQPSCNLSLWPILPPTPQLPEPSTSAILPFTVSASAPCA